MTAEGLPLVELVSGAIVALGTAIALFFLRFWRDTRDRLFLFFAIAFALLSVNRVALALLQEDEIRSYLYWVRLAAFIAILIAILDKNRRAAREGTGRIE